MKYVEKAVPKKTLSPEVDCVRYARDFCFSDDLENQTRFVWDGSHLLQEVQPDGRYTYINTDQDSYGPPAQVRNWTNEDGQDGHTQKIQERKNGLNNLKKSIKKIASRVLNKIQILNLST